jgi:transcriptional regulator of arginine metabolism
MTAGTGAGAEETRATGRATTDHLERRAVIAEIIRTERVGTQEELRLSLKSRGFDTTQATLSRDLARLKARRVSLPEGGTIYELEAFPAAGEDEGLEVSRDMVMGVEESLALVVVHTAAGAASAVAAVIDRARLSSVSGTIAGDDTIFIAPSKRSSVIALARELRHSWSKS